MVAQETIYDTIIVGGGLAGLTAAALLSNAGQKVVIVEKKSAVGGRGASHSLDGGFVFNQGAHALYNDGTARKVFKRLGLQLNGSYPAGSLNLRLNGKLGELPGNVIALLSSKSFSLNARIELFIFLAGLNGIKCDTIVDTDFEYWLGKRVRNEEVRKFLHSLARVATYAEGMNLMSAAAVVTQLKAALKGVTYLDGGWQSMVDQLLALCKKNNVTVLEETHIQSIRNAAETGTELVLSNGEKLSGTNLIVAVGPGVARELLDKSSYVTQATKEYIPIKAACLDLALTKLPNDKIKFVLNLDKPFYYSLHSAYAKITESGVILHLLKYLTPSENDSALSAVKEELESYMDELQPGWREFVVHERFLPAMIVSHRLDDYRHGGVAGRAQVQVPDLNNVYLAGDWVGEQGMLLDAAVSSAKQAAELILQKHATTPRQPQPAGCVSAL